MRAPLAALLVGAALAVHGANGGSGGSGHPPATGTVPISDMSAPARPGVPPAQTRVLSAELQALWAGIVTDNVHTALAAFFPESAYARVKAIADPDEDWQTRLVGEYTLDLAAAHRLVGSHAVLAYAEVPLSYAHWVPVGTCSNGLGYWEVPNSRLVYMSHGHEYSIGIASMISADNRWYVVHFGAVQRPSSGGGVVDAPAAGPGSPTYSGTC